MPCSTACDSDVRGDNYGGEDDRNGAIKVEDWPIFYFFFLPGLFLFNIPCFQGVSIEIAIVLSS